jgi:hypothetical protein
MPALTPPGCVDLKKMDERSTSIVAEFEYCGVLQDGYTGCVD